MHERILFGGLEEFQEPPSAYKRLQKRHGASRNDTFEQVLEHMEAAYNIEWRDLYTAAPGSDYDEHWHASYTEGGKLKGAEPVGHYRALVNPAWEGEEAEYLPGDRQDAVWHIPTKKYTKVAHHETWNPLYEAIMRLGSGADVFGAVRVRREGGEVHMDVFFENLGLDSPGDGTDDFTLGISTGHDYFGNTRLYIDVSAYHDTGDGVGQVMRYLSDPKRRKHTGDAGEEVVNWFIDAVERLDTVSDDLYGIVADAMDHEVPLVDFPCTVPGFYEHLGLPNRGESTLADPAGERAVKTAVGPYTAWHLYKAGMHALEHEYDSRDTSSFKKHVTTVNTLLYNPELAEKRALASMESDIESGDDSKEVFDFVDEDGSNKREVLDTVRSRAVTVEEGVEEVKEGRERLKRLLEGDGVKESEVDDDE